MYNSIAQERGEIVAPLFENKIVIAVNCPGNTPNSLIMNLSSPGRGFLEFGEISICQRGTKTETVKMI
jgi:hypothetical protein